MSAYTYIMASKTGTLYVGVTNDIERRTMEHKAKMHKGFTKKYHCNRLVYYQEIGDICEAILLEKKIKGLSRWKKEKLIRSQNPTWDDLARTWYDPEWFK
jgi:putative endonuclease